MDDTEMGVSKFIAFKILKIALFDLRPRKNRCPYIRAHNQTARGTAESFLTEGGEIFLSCCTALNINPERFSELVEKYLNGEIKIKRW